MFFSFVNLELVNFLNFQCLKQFLEKESNDLSLNNPNNGNMTKRGIIFMVLCFYLIDRKLIMFRVVTVLLQYFLYVNE